MTPTMRDRWVRVVAAATRTIMEMEGCDADEAFDRYIATLVREGIARLDGPDIILPDISGAQASAAIQAAGMLRN